jgi:hypothetical protein
MSVQFTTREAVRALKAPVPPAHAVAPTKKTQKHRSNANTRPRPLTFDLNQPGYVRVGHWLTLLCVSAPVFYKRLKKGQIPPADGSDGRPFWHTSTVREFLHK